MSPCMFKQRRRSNTGAQVLAFVVAVLLLLCTLSAKRTEADSVFISPNGDDHANGTFSAPFLTPQRALQFIALSRLDPKQKFIIQFLEGHYYVEDPIVINLSNIEVHSYDGEGKASLESNDIEGRVLILQNASNIYVEGLHLSHGRSFSWHETSGDDDPDGGALLISNCEAIEFRKCEFEMNKAGSGGAVSIRQSTNVYFKDCWFEGNKALSVNQVLFNSYNALRIGVQQSNIEVQNSRFFGNYPAYNSNLTLGTGGAVYITDGSTVTFMECVFLNNTAKEGGAVYIAGKSTGIFTQCRFARNAAQSGGSAFFVDKDATLRISENRVYENICGSYTCRVIQSKRYADNFPDGLRTFLIIMNVATVVLFFILICFAILWACMDFPWAKMRRIGRRRMQSISASSEKTLSMPMLSAEEADIQKTPPQASLYVRYEQNQGSTSGSNVSQNANALVFSFTDVLTKAKSYLESAPSPSEIRAAWGRWLTWKGVPGAKLLLYLLKISAIMYTQDVSVLVSFVHRSIFTLYWVCNLASTILQYYREFPGYFDTFDQLQYLVSSVESFWYVLVPPLVHIFLVIGIPHYYPLIRGHYKMNSKQGVKITGGDKSNKITRKVTAVIEWALGRRLLIIIAAMMVASTAFSLGMTIHDFATLFNKQVVEHGLALAIVNSVYKNSVYIIAFNIVFIMCILSILLADVMIGKTNAFFRDIVASIRKNEFYYEEAILKYLKLKHQLEDINYKALIIVLSYLAISMGLFLIVLLRFVWQSNPDYFVIFYIVVLVGVLFVFATTSTVASSWAWYLEWYFQEHHIKILKPEHHHQYYNLKEEDVKEKKSEEPETLRKRKTRAGSQEVEQSIPTPSITTPQQDDDEMNTITALTDNFEDISSEEQEEQDEGEQESSSKHRVPPANIQQIRDFAKFMTFLKDHLFVFYMGINLTIGTLIQYIGYLSGITTILKAVSTTLEQYFYVKETI